MLLSLHVKNLAIIDNINIEFQNGMTVITGETGAGKTLIIDAIGLLFGNRASSDFIRHGEERCIIEGVFSNFNDKVKSFCDELGIDINEDDMLVIRRELYANGKSICRVNGTIITLNQLKEISETLGDIHSQFDTQGLINPKNYLQFLNNFEIEQKLIEYQNAYEDYKQNIIKYKNLLNKKNEDNNRIEFLKYQINELEKANISISEEEELKERFKILNNFENIYQNFASFNNLFNDNNILENLYNATKYLEKLAEYDSQYQKLKENLTEAYYIIEDVFQSVAQIDIENEFDPNELEFINERLGLYADLRRKYKKTTEELVNYLAQVKEEISEIENYDFYLQKLEANAQESFQKVFEIAKELSILRKNYANEITTQIKNHLADLQLKNVSFEIMFTISEPQSFADEQCFKRDGIDEVDFLVSFNPGEPLRSLSKVASGGEMSRFMLALKTIMIEKLNLQLMIFDEIDSGVSGLVAHSIAKKIKTISQKHQVLCITHLPQVAASGDHHLKIIKKIDNDRTYSKAYQLNRNERIEEIAKMISDGIITEASKNMAEELINKFAK